MRPEVDLLREADEWLERFRRAVSDERVPPRLKAALRAIDSAIFEFCRFGSVSRFAAILCALGNAEREIAVSKMSGKNTSVPLAGLSPEWLSAANDGSVEFQIALALAGVHDVERKIGWLRGNLEPVDLWNWSESAIGVVWRDRDLSTNLISVLQAATP